MYCPACGAKNDDNAFHCVKCEALIQVAATDSPGFDPSQDAGMRMLLPIGRSIWAIAAGYLGLLSVLGIFAPLAVLIGVVAIRDIKKNPRLHGMGRAIFGIVMGVGCSIAYLILICS